MASNFPTAEDVALWDKYDATYGMDEAGQLRRGAKGPTMSMPEMQLSETVLDLANNPEAQRSAIKSLEEQIRNTPMDDPRREFLMRNYIASRRSGISSLGFDPSRMVVTDKEEQLIPGAGTLGFSINDYTYTKRDPRSPGSTMTHESMHRGIEQLIEVKDQEIMDRTAEAEDYMQVLAGRDKKPTKEEQNKLERLRADVLKAKNDREKLLSVSPHTSDKTHDLNETVTRALMQKNYGRIEQEGELTSSRDQYLKGMAYMYDNPEFLDELEKMAADELKRRGRPMGPR